MVSKNYVLILMVSVVRGRVLEELLDEVDVCHDHAAAAVALEAQLVHGISVDMSVLY